MRCKLLLLTAALMPVCLLVGSASASRGVATRVTLDSAANQSVAYSPRPRTAPTTAPLSAALFQDDFNDGNADGWTVLAGNWRVVGGEYIDDWAEGGMHVTAAGQSSWTDYVYQAQVLVQQREGGLAFRVSGDNRSGYMTTIRPAYGDALLMKAWDFTTGSHVWLQAVPFASSYETWYTIKVVVHGPDITVYVDGQPILSASDSEFASGKIGLYQVGSASRYDNVLVEGTSMAPVGGIAGLPDVHAPEAHRAEPASVSIWLRSAPIASAAAAGGALVLAAGAWYARRRHCGY